MNGRYGNQANVMFESDTRDLNFKYMPTGNYSHLNVFYCIFKQAEGPNFDNVWHINCLCNQFHEISASNSPNKVFV